MSAEVHIDPSNWVKYGSMNPRGTGWARSTKGSGRRARRANAHPRLGCQFRCIRLRFSAPRR
jgi:hypothetical protein